MMRELYPKKNTSRHEMLFFGGDGGIRTRVWNTYGNPHYRRRRLGFSSAEGGDRSACLETTRCMRPCRDHSGRLPRGGTGVGSPYDTGIRPGGIVGRWVIALRRGPERRTARTRERTRPSLLRKRWHVIVLPCDSRRSGSVDLRGLATSSIESRHPPKTSHAALSGAHLTFDQVVKRQMLNVKCRTGYLFNFIKALACLSASRFLMLARFSNCRLPRPMPISTLILPFRI